ncbi:hypothetical protein GCM10009539_85200 [Cryptosporangium japonicum]|uniref:Uncharacterized protein n=1 Tax=Cryptosporangium japonicum TaxID=80872 RepID=A0ABN0VBD5_9ACTN
MAADLDELLEEGDVRLCDGPVVGRGEQVARQVELSQELAGANRLVARDADEVAALAELGEAVADVG